MKLETFFEKFELFAEAPNGVEKLRELVLRLAVQGRLVPRSASDPPAAALAATISAERAAFVKARGLSRQRSLAPVEEGPGRAVTPAGWSWTRLGTLCRVQAGFAFDSAGFVQDGSGTPMIRIRDITSDCTQVNYAGEYRAEFLVDTGDFLVGMDGNFTVARWKGPRALLNQRVSRLQWYSDHIEPTFFAIALQQGLTALQGIKAYTTVDHLSSKQIEDTIVPLPPAGEQRRIVEKVHKLMAWCDRLEAQRRERDQRRATLAQASMSRFAGAPTPDNLKFLFHDSYEIEPADLRLSILTLAVRGRLEPQDPMDGDLERSIAVARRRAGLSAEWSGGQGVEAAFETPHSWRWVTVADVAASRLGKMLDKAKNRGQARPYLRNTNVHWFRFELDSIKAMAFEDSELDEYRVEPGDVLICEGGHGIARSAVWQGQVPGIMFQKALHRVRPLACLNPHFLTFCLWVYERDGLLHRYYTGAGIPHFTGQSLARVPLPLPPIAEQDRIVAKASRLLALVGKLETQIESTGICARRLTEAVVAELTAQG